MRILAALIATSVLLPLGVPQVQAKDMVTDIKGWKLTVRPSPGETPDQGCFLWSPKTAEGTQLRVTNRVNPDAKIAGATRGSGQIRIIVPDMVSSQPEAPVLASFEIPGVKKWENINAVWSSDEKVISAFVDDKVDAVLAPVSRGATFQVSFALSDGQKKTYAIPLKDSFFAVSAFEHCLASVTWERPKPKP